MSLITEELAPVELKLLLILIVPSNVTCKSRALK